jgi:hypothetical protein
MAAAHKTSLSSANGPKFAINAKERFPFLPELYCMRCAAALGSPDVQKIGGKVF